MAEPGRVAELRALAVLEVELDRMIAERVAAARTAGMSWEAIAGIVGVAKPTAWRRWKDIVQDPRPTGALRHDRTNTGEHAVSPEAARRAVEQIYLRAVDRSVPRWSDALRSALEARSLRYAVRRSERSGTTYELAFADQDVLFEAREAPDGSGSVDVTREPRASGGPGVVDGAVPKSGRIDGGRGLSDAEVLDRVTGFVHQHLS